MGNVRLPFDAMKDDEQISSATGDIDATWSKDQLLSVFVHSENLGHQRLRLISDGRPLFSETLSVHSSKASISIEDTRSPAAQLGGIEIVLWTSESLDDDEPTLTWTTLKADQQGNFGECKLAEERCVSKPKLPNALPYTLSYNDPISEQRYHRSKGPLKFLLTAATSVSGRIVEANTGIGVPNLIINYFDVTGRNAVTDANGRFHFWAEDDTVYFPIDPLGRFVMKSSVYIYLQTWLLMTT